MPNNYKSFFEGKCFALVGNSKKKNFPMLTYQNLILTGRTVFPLDPGLEKLEENIVYRSIKDLPEKPDSLILEVPKEEILEWIDQAIENNIKNVWIHQGCDTHEAVQKAKDGNIELRTGTCAVMYLTTGFNSHGIHRGIMKLLNKY